MMKYLILTVLVTIMMTLSAQAQDQNYKKAVLAGGCFWCIEADFEKLDGIIEAISGYSGGDMSNPTYQNYNKPSGGYRVPHIEVIQVTYDPQKLSYRQILEYHVRHIDPTDGGGQFCDRGPGYIPAIFVENDEEREIASAVLQDTANIIRDDVKVRILDAKPFYPAEDYHQDYAEKNAVRYKFYRWNCGRDQRIEEIWKK